MKEKKITIDPVLYQKFSDEVDAWLNKENPKFITIDNELLKKEDYEGLVNHREAMSKIYPDEYDWELLLPEAYLLNKNYDKSIAYLSKLHKKDPDNDMIHYLILESLFAQGKDEKDFKWRVKPAIVKLDNDALDYSCKVLSKNRDGMALHRLYCEFMSKGFARFSENDFYEAMRSDARFEIFENSDIEQSVIKISKK